MNCTLFHLLHARLEATDICSYNCGHLIEAAVIHSLGPDQRLIKVMERYVELLMSTFGPDQQQLHGYPGHPEIELALIRLFKATDEPSYLRLARYFLEERGKPNPHFYDVEARVRGDTPGERRRERAWW